MTRKPRSHVRILKYRTRAIHAKSKTRFQLANQKISSGNVYMIQNCFKFLDCNSCLMFKLSTVCGTLKESALLISIIKLHRNHTRNASKKTTICFNRKKATWSLRKKKENEKEIQANLTESLHLTVETRISENITQTVNAETTKRLLMKNLPWHAIR